jgi:hypothetical protein
MGLSQSVRGLQERLVCSICWTWAVNRLAIIGLHSPPLSLSPILHVLHPWHISGLSTSSSRIMHHCAQPKQLVLSLCSTPGPWTVNTWAASFSASCSNNNSQSTSEDIMEVYYSYKLNALGMFAALGERMNDSSHYGKASASSWNHNVVVLMSTSSLKTIGLRKPCIWCPTASGICSQTSSGVEDQPVARLIKSSALRSASSYTTMYNYLGVLKTCLFQLFHVHHSLQNPPGCELTVSNFQSSNSMKIAKDVLHNLCVDYHMHENCGRTLCVLLLRMWVLINLLENVGDMNSSPDILKGSDYMVPFSCFFSSTGENL